MAIIEDLHMKDQADESIDLTKLEPVEQKIRVLAGLKISRKEILPVAPTLKMPIYASAEKMSPATQEESRPFSESILTSVEEVNAQSVQTLQRFFAQAADDTVRSEAPAREVASKETESMDLAPLTVATIHNLKKPSAGETPATPSTPDQSLASTEASTILSGLVEVMGVGLTGQESVVVYREMSGRRIEEGSVDIQRGEFSLQAKEAKGFLRAEVLAADGTPLGDGEIWLNSLKTPSKRISGLKIKIDQKSSSSFVGTASSAYGTDESEHPVLGAKLSYTSSVPGVTTNKVGRFEAHGIHPKSSVVLTAEKKGYWNSLVLTSAQHRAAVTLYPQSMISALQQTIAKDFGLKADDLQNGGIVWGRVLKGRKPIEGAVVESAGSQGIGPIYFNSLHLPDTKLQATSNNGLFVFLNLPSGTQSIRAQVRGRYLPAKILPVEDRHVTPVEIVSGKKSVAIVQSFDALSRESVPTTIRFAASPKSIRTNMAGLAKVSVAQTEEPLFLEADPTGDYLPIRMSFDRRDKHMFLPQIRGEWLNTLRLNRFPNTGMIVGIVEGKRYDVFLDINGKPHNDILYFNASGEITPMPLAGGGFLIYNVPHGIRTVSIVSEGADNIYHQVVSVDDEYVAVVAHVP